MAETTIKQRKTVPRYKRSVKANRVDEHEDDRKRPDMRTSVDIRVPRYRHILDVLYRFDEYLTAVEIAQLIPKTPLPENRRVAIAAAHEKLKESRGDGKRVSPPPKVPRVIHQALQKLYHAGYVDRRSMGLQHAPLYLLDKRAVAVLHEGYGVDHEDVLKMLARHGVGDFAIEHMRMVRRFHVALHHQLAGSETNLIWHNELWLREKLRAVNGQRRENKRQVFPIADAYFTLTHPTSTLHYFYEADRGTMQLKRFAEKGDGYFALWERPRQGKSALETIFGINHFHIATATVSPTRRDNLLKAMKLPKGQTAATRHWTLGNFSFCVEKDYLDQPSNLISQIWKSAPDADTVHGFPGMEA